MAKFFIILLVVGAALAFPAEDTVTPLNAAETQGSDAPLAPVPLPEQNPLPGTQEQGLAQGAVKPEGTDLKTDNSYWWRSGYYPVVYERSYYRPRTYSYYPYYSYSWYPYW